MATSGGGDCDDLLVIYLDEVQALIQKCRQFQHIKGMHKLEKNCRAELRYLQSLTRKHSLVHESQLKSSNLCHFAGILHAMQVVPGVVRMMKTVPSPHRIKSDSLNVDIVAGQGQVWVKVIARKAQALHLVWAGQGQFGEHDLITQAEDYLTCARSNPVHFQPPTVHFAFYSQVTMPMAEALEERGVRVWGERVPVDKEVQLKLQSLDGHLTDSDELEVTDSDSEESSLKHEHRNLCRKEDFLNDLGDDGTDDLEDFCDDLDEDGAVSKTCEDFGNQTDTESCQKSTSDSTKKNSKNLLHEMVGSTVTSLSECCNPVEVRSGDIVTEDESSPCVRIHDKDREEQTSNQCNVRVETVSHCVKCDDPTDGTSHQGQREEQTSDQCNVRVETVSHCVKCDDPTDGTSHQGQSFTRSVPVDTNGTSYQDKICPHSVPVDDSVKEINCICCHSSSDIANSNPSHLCSAQSQPPDKKELFISSLLTSIPRYDISSMLIGPECSNVDKSGTPEKVNLDITTLITMVSAVTHGGCHFEFPEKVLTMQAMEERDNPALPPLRRFLHDKELYACETAWQDFQTILTTLGGPGEKRRAEQLLKRVKVITDQPSKRSQDLPDTGKIRSRSKVIFGTGDTLRAVTTTANVGFVRAAEHQGVSFAIYSHPSRALTEQKERTAKLLE